MEVIDMLIDLNNTYFSGNIRYLRKRFHLSRRALAALAGISPRELRRIEKAKVSVDYAVAARFRDIFGLPMEVLFHEKSPPFE